MSHSPLLNLPGPSPELHDDIDAALAEARDFVHRFNPELVVIFAPDHYNGFFYKLMPPFCLGTAACGVGDYETRDGPLNVAADIAADCAAAVLAAGIDLAISAGMEVDHGTVQPLQELFGDPTAVPVVPIFINSVATPLGPLSRSRALGSAVGAFLADRGERVLVLGSGGLSHDPPMPTLATAAGAVFGESAKVVDFNDGRGMRIRHVARFCEVLGVGEAHFVGNSMGAIMLLTDATSACPLLPARTLVAICGGGDILRNQYMEALYGYDATVAGMRRIVEALFFDPCYPADDDYVRRRHDSSVAPGAWEAVAAARFRRPGLAPPPTPSSTRAYQRIAVPTLVVGGGGDKLLPVGWAARLAEQIRGGRSVVVERAGHCPQIERPDVVNTLLEIFSRSSACVEGDAAWSTNCPARSP